MKDSGIPWIGEIPYNWDVKKGKNILHLHKRPVRKDDEVITCFRDGEVVLRSLRRTEGFTMSDKEIGYQGINEGDIVIHGMDGFAGAMGVSKSTGKGSPILVVCSPKYDSNSQYIIYYLRTLAMLDVFVSMSTGIRERSCDLRWSKISELEFILPTSEEQFRIANHLDKKCAEIDKLISVQERMIEKLTTYKQSVITEAVTKGLDPNVSMKDSGVKWIGKIPEHWKVSAIKRNLQLYSGATPKTDNELYWNGGIAWITPADYKTEDRWIECGSRYISEEGFKSCALTMLPKGSIIFSKRAPIGLVIMNSAPLCTNQGCIGCVPFNGNGDYYYYAMSICPEQFELLGSGTTFKEISATSFSNFILPTPTIEEQSRIANYLDKKCAEIDRMIEIKRKKIEKLNTYKKSIIFEYVTGKKEVPHA